MHNVTRESREFPRAAAARLAHLALNDGRHIHGRTIDLALRGAALELTEALAEGDAGVLTLSIDGGLVEIAARVVRVRPLGGCFETALTLGKTSRTFVNALATVFADAMG